MTEVVALMVFAMLGMGATLKGLSWYQRWRVVRRLDPEQITRQARGASMRVMVQGSRLLPGMSRTRANRTRGDLILMSDRLLLTSSRGTLLDLRNNRGKKLSSARCTGPGRLILEGTIPVPSGPPGLYRIELQVDEASAWATELGPWTEGKQGKEAFGSWGP